jgi:AcrR family transcriptional regulator
MASDVRPDTVPDRRQRSLARIIETTLELMREKGPAGVTIEGVSAASGVAKTTIYRHFANRGDMLHAAIDSLTRSPLPAPDVPTREKFRWVLDSARQGLRDGLGLGGVAALLSEQDPEFTQAARAVLTPYIEHLVELFGRAMAAGNVRADVDVDAVLSLIVGACLGEQLRFGRIRDTWLDATTDAIWRGVAARPTE